MGRKVRNAFSTIGRGIRKALQYLLLGLIRFYRSCISPYTPRSCRFTPTCSQYAYEAVSKYGPIKGTYLAVRRLLKCHPFHKGGYDPVP